MVVNMSKIPKIIFFYKLDLHIDTWSYIHTVPNTRSWNKDTVACISAYQFSAFLQCTVKFHIVYNIY